MQDPGVNDPKKERVSGCEEEEMENRRASVLSVLIFSHLFVSPVQALKFSMTLSISMTGVDFWSLVIC